ncbi:hypothetical protein [Streptomyces erythrochromogenes]|uniref:hypothetical protein n=1 Tax=Streptomyces erythrochromogenes TaxID=285574 RepID=UPI003699D7CB
MIAANVVGCDDRVYPAQVSELRWNGGVVPFFTLDTMRTLAADTAADAAKYGHDRLNTVHVIEGGTDVSGQPQAVVLAICWTFYDQDGPKNITRVITPTAEGLYPGAGLDHAWQLADETTTEPA